MPKKGKILKFKYYFTLEEKVHKNFSKYVEENFIDKQKLMENLVIQYMIKNNIKLDD